MNTPAFELGFIGAGNMAEAIVRGAIERDILDPSRLIAADVNESRRAVFADMGIEVTDRAEQVVEQSQQVLLAVKPQKLDDIRISLGKTRTDAQIIISIMAGIRSAKIEDVIGKPARIVRVMPNTPILVGQGMTGIALGKHAMEDDDELAMRIFAAGDNQAVRVDEEKLDAITAVSGSGPAYLFYLAEAMEIAAKDLGLEEHAQLLAQQTLLGAAMLLHESDDSAEDLRCKVTSPRGTTEAAIQHMINHKVGSTIVAAIKAAAARSKELGG